MLPKDIRRKLKIRKGEEFLVMELDNETIILRRFDVKSMLQDIVMKAEKINLKKLEKEIGDDGNRVAREKYKISD